MYDTDGRALRRFELGYENGDRCWIEITETRTAGGFVEIEVNRRKGNTGTMLQASEAAPWLELYHRRETARRLHEAAARFESALGRLDTISTRLLELGYALHRARKWRPWHLLSRRED